MGQPEKKQDSHVNGMVRPEDGSLQSKDAAVVCR